MAWFANSPAVIFLEEKPNYLSFCGKCCFYLLFEDCCSPEGPEIHHKRVNITPHENRIYLYLRGGSYRCQGVCQLGSSPGLPSPAGLAGTPSSGDLACPQPARGSCWTEVSAWWRRGWAGWLARGCCSLPCPWSQYCCRWHHQTAWCPFSPLRRTVKHLKQKRIEKGRGIMESWVDTKLTIFKVINAPCCSGARY